MYDKTIPNRLTHDPVSPSAREEYDYQVGMGYKCEDCGGEADFDESTCSWHCPHAVSEREQRHLCETIGHVLSEEGCAESGSSDLSCARCGWTQSVYW